MPQKSYSTFSRYSRAFVIRFSEDVKSIVKKDCDPVSLGYSTNSLVKPKSLGE